MRFYSNMQKDWGVQFRKASRSRKKRVETVGNHSRMLPITPLWWKSFNFFCELGFVFCKQFLSIPLNVFMLSEDRCFNQKNLWFRKNFDENFIISGGEGWSVSVEIQKVLMFFQNISAVVWAAYTAGKTFETKQDAPLARFCLIKSWWVDLFM